jgi:hypothetical protein
LDFVEDIASSLDVENPRNAMEEDLPSQTSTNSEETLSSALQEQPGARVSADIAHLCSHRPLRIGREAAAQKK